jgi:hypothetical protein
MLLTCEGQHLIENTEDPTSPLVEEVVLWIARCEA